MAEEIIRELDKCASEKNPNEKAYGLKHVIEELKVSDFKTVRTVYEHIRSKNLPEYFKEALEFDLIKRGYVPASC
jgi:hypothetical protein